MQKVTIYTKPLCPYCVRALALFQKKGVVVEEICAAFDEKRRAEMLQRSKGKRTYPQIFVGETHIGGFDELAELERAGKLDPLLNAA